MSRKDESQAARALLSKPIVKVGLFSILHFLVFLFVLFNSFQYVYPGEPGYEATLGRRAEMFGLFANVLGFPVLWLVYLVSWIPNALLRYVGWSLPWFWMGVNSVVWGCGMHLFGVGLGRVRRRLKAGEPS